MATSIIIIIVIKPLLHKFLIACARDCTETDVRYRDISRRKTTMLDDSGKLPKSTHARNTRHRVIDIFRFSCHSFFALAFSLSLSLALNFNQYKNNNL